MDSQKDDRLTGRHAILQEWLRYIRRIN